MVTSSTGCRLAWERAYASYWPAYLLTGTCICDFCFISFVVHCTWKAKSKTSHVRWCFSRYELTRLSLLNEQLSFITKCDSYVITKCHRHYKVRCYYKVWRYSPSATFFRSFWIRLTTSRATPSSSIDWSGVTFSKISTCRKDTTHQSAFRGTNTCTEPGKRQTEPQVLHSTVQTMCASVAVFPPSFCVYFHCK